MDYTSLKKAAEAAINYQFRRCPGTPCSCLDHVRLMHEFQSLARPVIILEALRELEELKHRIESLEK